MSSKQYSSTFIDRSTTQSYSGDNHGHENMHQCHYRKRSNQNFHQRNNNFNNHRRRHNNNRNERLPLPQSMDCVGDDNNRDYLKGNQILKWFNDKSTTNGIFPIINDYATYAYVTIMASIHDKWIRNDYERKLWKAYLKLGEEKNYWTVELLQSTKSFHDDINIEFLEEKIRELDDNINFLIDDLYECDITMKIHKERNCGKQPVEHLFTFSEIIITEEVAFLENNLRDFMNQLEEYVRNYVMHCTRHFRKSIDTKIQLAKAQVHHF